MTPATPTSLVEMDRLASLAEIAKALDLARLHDEAFAVAARAAEGWFFVACVGQFKRGKSTLIDALLDDPILPSGIVPVTAVPTIVRYGEQRTARVRLGADAPDGTETTWRSIDPGELALYVSEEHNPGNERGVVAVEVFVPRPALARGMCLVDTPGLGSVVESNTAATRAFIPHIDAALVVLGADPPVSGAELELIDDVGRHADNLIFVLNKADRRNPRGERCGAALPHRARTRLASAGQCARIAQRRCGAPAGPRGGEPSFSPRRSRALTACWIPGSHGSSGTSALRSGAR